MRGEIKIIATQEKKTRCFLDEKLVSRFKDFIVKRRRAENEYFWEEKEKHTKKPKTKQILKNPNSNQKHPQNHNKSKQTHKNKTTVNV